MTGYNTDDIKSRKIIYKKTNILICDIDVRIDSDSDDFLAVVIVGTMETVLAGTTEIVFPHFACGQEEMLNY